MEKSETKGIQYIAESKRFATGVGRLKQGTWPDPKSLSEDHKHGLTSSIW